MWFQQINYKKKFIQLGNISYIDVSRNCDKSNRIRLVLEITNYVSGGTVFPKVAMTLCFVTVIGYG